MSSLILIGLDHHTAPVAIREQVAFSPQQIEAALPSLCAYAKLDEAFILSTCNRTEIYAVAKHSADIVAWLCETRQLVAESLTPHLYFHHALAVVKHLNQVASGLNSMVLGEPQIFGQVKAAYQLAKAAGTMGRQLHHVCQHSFYVTKKIRTDTQIGQRPVSIAFTAVSLVKRIFTKPATCRVLLLGAGETIELVTQHLSDLGAHQFTFVNRSLARASALAAQWRGDAFELSELASLMGSVDIIIAATDSPVVLVQAKDLARARHAQRRKPLLLIDLAVPRNIDPLISDQSDCYLYGLDDLQALIEESIAERHIAARQCDAIIEVEMVHFSKKLHHLQKAPKIKALYQQANACRDQQVKEALHALTNGVSPEAVVQQLAHRLTQQLVHIPALMLKEND